MRTRKEIKEDLEEYHTNTEYQIVLALRAIGEVLLDIRELLESKSE